jgi:hypothetical protein
MTVRFPATFLACLVWVLATAPRLGASVTLNFAHLADGSDGIGVWTTNFSVVDTSSSSATCNLALWGDDGKPLSLATSMGTNSTFTATIPTLGTLELQTSGNGVGGSVVGGYATLTCDNPVFGADVYTYTTAAGGPVAQVGVLSQTAGDRFSSSANAYTGVAIVNLSPTSTMTVTINVFDTLGNLTGSNTLSFNPLQHMAFTLDNEVPVPSNFLGSVEISSDINDMIGIALGFVPNKTTYTSSAIPSIFYTHLANSYSGTCTIIGGPYVGTSATCTASGITPTGWGEFEATSSLIAHGQTYQGQLIMKESPTPAGAGVIVSIDSINGGADGSFLLNPDGTLTGVVQIRESTGIQDILSMTLSPGS